MDHSRSARPWAAVVDDAHDAASMRGALMVCGATSDSGKTTLVAGLCRSLARRGVSVAPFKAQNMSLNSAITADGREVGRAQALQATAARIDVEAQMNPVLLKPTGERTCQVVRMGEPWRTVGAGEYHDLKPELLPIVLDALADLRARYDVVLLEGAGSPAEINLIDRDIVNLPLARHAGVPAIVVGDINLGGVFASLFGTVELLPPDLRSCVQGFVINKFRGDPALLLDGCDQLQSRTGLPTFGVVPWIDQTGLDAEDSMALDRSTPADRPPIADVLDVAVIRLPRVSNFTDLEPLGLEAGVSVRWVHHPSMLGDPDLIVIPGSKATVDDLDWLRSVGLDAAIAASDACVLGICAGYQMLGAAIDDPIESAAGPVDGLGLLPATTTFEVTKVTRRRSGTALDSQVSGYQIHHGRVRPAGGEPFVTLRESTGDPTVDGVHNGRVFGTTLHGLFDADAFRREFLRHVARHRGKHWISDGIVVADVRDLALERLADAIDAHLDTEALERIITSARQVALR